MFPYFLLYPIWVVVSMGFPALSSLHALNKRDAAEMRVWLFYWIAFAILGLLFSLPMVETVISIPFSVVGAVLFDVYYEAQIVLVGLLTNPKMRMLDQVIEKIDNQAEVQKVLKLVSEKFEEFEKKFLKKGE